MQKFHQRNNDCSYGLFFDLYHPTFHDLPWVLSEPWVTLIWSCQSTCVYFGSICGMPVSKPIFSRRCAENKKNMLTMSRVWSSKSTHPIWFLITAWGSVWTQPWRHGIFMLWWPRHLSSGENWPSGYKKMAFILCFVSFIQRISHTKTLQKGEYAVNLKL